MITRDDLEAWVLQAVKDLGGKGRVIDIAKSIWTEHEGDLRRAGDLFFTWQYDMRWAAMKLRKKKKLKAASSNKVWELA